MNNIGTISRIIKHIQTETPDYQGPMVEVTLASRVGTAKSRLMYVLGYNDEEMTELQRLINESVDMNIYHATYDFKQNMHDYIRKYALANRQTLESNWRGRLFYFRDLQGAENRTEFLLKSYWRLIVTQDVEGKFYTRHDLHPVFWSPGFSIAGQETFADEVERILLGLQNRRNLLIDDSNDYLRVYARRAGAEAFQNVPLTPSGQNEIYEYRMQDVNFQEVSPVIAERLRGCFI